MAIVLGLVSALAWGVSDFLSRTTTHALGAFRAQMWAQLWGMILLSVVVVAHGDLARARAVTDVSAWVWLGVFSVVVSVAVLTLFRAFAQGALAIVAPITGAYGAVTVVLSLIAGVHLDGMRAAGLASLGVGVVLASIEGGPSTPDRSRVAPGVLWAIVAALLFGGAFFVLGHFVTSSFGGVFPPFFGRAVGAVLLGIIARFMGVSMHPPTGRARWHVVIAGTLGSTASVATALGLHGNSDDAVVAMLGSLSVVITVLISLVVLRERMRVHQWIGVALTIAGMPLLT